VILLSIPEEAALCRAAFAGVKVGAMVQHCHHGWVIEPLTQPPEKRIAYILSDKPIKEQALRLHLFRPVRNAAVDVAQATWDAALDAARATYNAVIEAAEATYNAADKAARATCDAAVKAARATYATTAVDAAWATYAAADKPAWATYDAAVKAARATYHAAVGPAWVTRDAALDAAHQAECPDCPWNGRTIFPVATP